MSLDVYIKNKKKEDREWVANITHNMNKMAQKIFVSENKETLYDYVWRPEELGREIDTDEMKNVLTKGICIMISKRKSLLRYEPENGWGSYDSFLKFLIEYKEACEDNPGYIIEASR